MGKGSAEEPCEWGSGQRCPDVLKVKAAVFGDDKPEQSVLARLFRVETTLALVRNISVATLIGVLIILARMLIAILDRGGISP